MSNSRRQNNQIVLPDPTQLRVLELTSLQERPGSAASRQHQKISVDQLHTGSRLQRPRTGYSPGSAERSRRVSSVQTPVANLVDAAPPRQRRISAYELRTRGPKYAEDSAGPCSAPTPRIRVDPPPLMLPARRCLPSGQRSRPTTAASLVAPECPERPRAWSVGSRGVIAAAAAGTPPESRRRSSGTQPADVLAGLDRRLPVIVDPQLSDADIKQFHSTLMSRSPAECFQELVEQENGTARWSELWRVNSTGDKRGQIHAVRGICFAAGGRMAVTEGRNGRVQLFQCRPTRRSSNILQPASSGGRKRASRRRFQPGGVCTVPSEVASTDAWLAVTDVDRVLIFDEDTGKVDELNVEERTGLCGVAVTGRGRLVLTDAGVRPTVGLHDFTSGQLVSTFDLSVEFQKPLHVAVNVDYSVTCVSDSERRCVYLFDRDGRIRLATVTGDGGGGGSRAVCRRFTYPAGICCVDEGRSLLVVDSVEHCIYSYDFRNRQLLPLLTAQEHGLRHPSCIAADLQGGADLLGVVEEFDDVMIDQCQLKLFTRNH